MENEVAALRARVAELETAWRVRLRREQRARVKAQTKLEDAERSPWTFLPYLGVVPRYVGPGDPLRKLKP